MKSRGCDHSMTKINMNSGGGGLLLYFSDSWGGGGSSLIYRGLKSNNKLS